MSDNKEENIALTSFDIADLDLYKKKIENICFIKSLDIEKAGGKIKIPTLEGEVIVEASEDVYIMLGSFDDVYPIPKDLFCPKAFAKAM